MPIHQLADAGASSTVSGAITAVQTSVTVASATGFPALLSTGQLSVVILDSGNPAYSVGNPLATPFEYQPVNAIAGNVLTFGSGGGGASRAAYAGTTPHAYFAGATVAAAMLAEDFAASAAWKFDDQNPSGGAVTIPASGSIPATQPGVSWRSLRVRWRARTTSGNVADALTLRLNGDTGANYRADYSKVDLGIGSSTEVAGTTSIQIANLPGNGAAANLYSAGWFEIPGYGDSFNKVIAATTMSVDSGLRLWVIAGLWFATAAVTSVSLAASAGAWATGSWFSAELVP